MPSITELAKAPAKILLIGKSGAGKTGSQAALVAAGYNLRIIDTDKGVKTLYSLLTDDRYPYAKLIKQKNIDIGKAVNYIPIDTAMKLRRIAKKLPNGSTTSEMLLAPADANAWPSILDKLDHWKDGDIDLGPIRSWTGQDVLVLDSFSTIATCAYYHNQSMNGRLGARDEGYDYQRDIGGAQSQLKRLLELLYDSTISCNVIVISHITWVDDSQGVASRPRTGDGTGATIISNADGYPSAIGRALSPQMGKYFNDTFIARSTGTGNNVRRTISTVPQDGVLAKNSVFLDREYPTSYALAEIFAAIRGAPRPLDLLEACKANSASAPNALPRTAATSSAPAPVTVS
jgi:hypothetical protein